MGCFGLIFNLNFKKMASEKLHVSVDYISGFPNQHFEGDIEYETNPMKAIRLKCLDCCCDSSNEVKLCTSVNCSLYPFRLGKNPFRKKRVLTEEEKKKLIEQLKKKS